ncbi:MAG: nitrous oxide-stimulated promoter family protein [Arcobacter sp.]|nr:nitrous oxide-stimulated promoter family protein [Arcobacter sp.]
MDIIKFKDEINTLKKFFEVYCKNHHNNQQYINKSLHYKNEEIQVELNLCPECLSKLNYSYERLLECPHDIKPRCRKCPSPCYEKKQWKDTAKVMRYSGVKLGITALNKKIKKLICYIK